MQDYNNQQTRDYTVHRDGVLESTGTVPGATSQYFDVNGFGPNPGKRRVDPTPGDYYIWRAQGPKGTRRVREYNWGYWDDPVVTREWNGYLGTLSDTVLRYSPFTVQIPVPTPVYNGALEDLYGGIRKSEVNLAVLIGEIGETGRMLKVGRSIYEILQMARRAKRELLMNPSRTISSIWLGYQYGWKPLYNEVYGYLNWLYQVFDDGVDFKGFTQVKDQFDQRNLGTENGQVYRASGLTRNLCEVQIRAGLSDTTAYNLNRITSLNPIAIAWELIPLSFVWDWFQDVGGYLHLMEQALYSGLSFKRGYITEVSLSKQNATTDWDLVQYPYPWKKHFDGRWEGYEYKVWKRRQKLTSFPLPRAPTFSLKLGWQRIASATALLRTILLSGVKGKHV